MTDARMKSADDLIVAVEREQLGKTAIQPAKQESIEQPEVEEQIPSDLKEEQDLENTEPETEKSQETQQEVEEKSKASDDSSDVDEYGNKIAKERTYTQAEVQEMIRKRVATIKNAEAQVQPQPVQTTEEPVEEWQQQLKSEIKNTIEEVKKQEQEQAWRAQQEAEQAAYEEKFSQSMSKYNDFESVVTGKPITASMMMATKAMQDPAAFIYAVCKNAPDELGRIAKIPDPHVQIAEMARLEERMKKPRVVTNAPKPSRKISGDASSEMPKHSIDSLIATHAREKIIKTRRLK